MNASNFDQTELKTLGEMALVFFGGDYLKNNLSKSQETTEDG